MKIKTALLESEIIKVINFLKKMNLRWEEDIIRTFYIEKDNKVIATASRSLDTIKCLAIDNDYQGYNLTTKLIEEVIKSFNQDKIYHYFVYTTINNVVIFNDLGFKEISRTDQVAVFEKGINLIDEQLQKIKSTIEFHFTTKLENHSIGAFVGNCNPVTIGHIYLIEEMAKNHDFGIVFLVEEDLSFFSYKERYSLLYLSLGHLDNVMIVPSTKYMVSNLTFPSYFLTSPDEVIKEQTYLDAKIFKDYFVKAFNISKRYIAFETKDYMNTYNKSLKKVLLDKIIEVPRLKLGSEIISASKVRELVAGNQINDALEYIPNNVKTLFKAIIESKNYE